MRCIFTKLNTEKDGQHHNDEFIRMCIYFPPHQKYFRAYVLQRQINPIKWLKFRVCHDNGAFCLTKISQMLLKFRLIFHKVWYNVFIIYYQEVINFKELSQVKYSDEMRKNVFFLYYFSYLHILFVVIQAEFLEIRNI